MEFRVSKLKIAGYVLLALGFVVVGVFMVNEEGFKAVIVGWISIAFFGFGALVLMNQLFKDSKEAAVVIDELGIHDRRTQIGLIPWSDISRVWVGVVNSQRFLCVETYSKSQRVSSMAAKGNAILGFPAVTIGFNGLNPGLGAAVRYIQDAQPSKFSVDATLP